MTKKGPKSPAAFLSYVHEDDKHGHITKLRERLCDEVEAAVGVEFPIFQDRKDIEWGDNWRERIVDSLDAVTFLIPVISPRFFNSTHCRGELRRFLEREKRLGRSDLILPIYFIDTPLLNDEEERAEDDLAEAIASRQYSDWRELRFEPFTNPQVGKTLQRLAIKIRDTLPRPRAAKKPAAAPPTPAPAESQPASASAGEVIDQAAQNPTPKNEPPTCVVHQMPRRGDFTTITEAIEKSEPGTKIIVKPGFYQEGLVIDKPLEIIGDGDPGEVVVKAIDKAVILFRTTMGRVANLTLKEAGGSDSHAVDISQGRLELEDCDITSQSLSCVFIRNGADPRLRRNRIHDSKQAGILVYDNGQGTLEDNDIFGNALAGVEIREGGNPTLRRNRIHDGKEGGVYINQNGLGTLEDNDIFGNAYAGVSVISGGSPIVRRNRINKNNFHAVWVQKAGGGTFEGNDLRENAKGAWYISPDCVVNVKRSNNQE